VKKKEIRETSIEEKYADSYLSTISTREIMGVPMATIKYDQYKQVEIENPDLEPKPTSIYHWFGSDYLGRDLWTRLWRGLRVSFLISLIAMAVNIFVGIVYGAVSGYYGGWTDLIMQRIIEILGGVPYLVIVILFVFYYGPGIVPLALAMCMTGWIGMSRMIRAQFLKYKEMEYVLASRTLGASDRTLIFRHILPNAIGIIITMAALEIPGAIFSESFLAYIGLGIQAPESSIGVLLADGQKVLLEHPHLTVFPSIVISVMMIAFNLMGNGLRDAFDPTLRGIE
ncbi:MAG: ABC transporter permease, partial [Ezakiella massiliensis]